MSLQFIGDAGIYFPERDAIKIIAFDGESSIECFVVRSALAAIGCRLSDQPRQIARKFEARRLDCELAATIKFRQAIEKLRSLEITAADLAVVERFARRLAESGNGYSDFSRAFATRLPIGPIF